MVGGGAHSRRLGLKKKRWLYRGQVEKGPTFGHEYGQGNFLVLA